VTVAAVQTYIKDTLNGVPAEGYGTPIRVMVRPLVVDNVKVEAPLGYVWGGTGTVSRVTIPRGQTMPDFVPAVLKSGTAGWKKTVYDGLRVWLIGTDRNNNPTGDVRFPTLLQAILDVLQATTMPTRLTDPITSEPSWLMDLGEDIVWDYDLDRTTGDQRLLRSAAVLTVPAMEMYQA
jgi:hypothetical protein